MGPFPFIRFEQAEINGNFGDEYAYRKTQIQVLNALFVDNYFNGDKFFIAVNEIKNEIQLLNDAPFFASLELILPSPYPTSLGVEVYTLKIGIQQNNECFIEILFNLTDGVVTANDTTFTAGPDLVEVTTNRPFIAEELKIAKTLLVYQQNGAAIFPDTFDFDSTTGIAERRLLRAYDWKYNTSSNQPQREGITDLRMIPKTVFNLRELLQIEKAMVSFFLEKPIKESLTNDNWNATNIYLPSLPEGWVYSSLSPSSSQKQLSILKENQIAFILAGKKVDGKWYFQRFVDPYYVTGSLPDIASILMGTLPASPNNGKLYNPGSSINFYDFDQCEFGTVVNEEPFNLLIKSGDNYQINVLKDFIFEPEIGPEKLIGIFDCNRTFIQKIGEIGFPPVVIPDCIETFTTKIFFPAADNATKYWNWPTVQLVSAPGLAFLKMYLVDSNLNETFEAQFSMEFGAGADLDTFDLAIFCPQLEALIEGLGYTCVVTYVEGDEPPPQIEPQITVQITADICDVVAINFVFTYTFVGTLYTYNVGLYTPIVLPDQPVIPTQYQATITIPPLPNGNYFIGIYQAYESEGQDYATLLAMSQSLALDNFEEFTQILEFGSAQDSIIEGFEYLNGWLQRIRVPLNGAGQTYSLEESIYRNSDGTFQKPQNSTDENISLHTDYLDLQTQRAMTSATRHPIFVLANQNLSVQGDLEIATNQDYTTNQSFRKLQQMRFQAKNQGYQPNNNSCLG